MKKALLIGNDINNATESYSWNDLIEDLLEYAKVSKTLSRENKPFPLLYEEIYLNAAKERQTPESRLKEYIASKTRRIKPNELHKLILDLNIENIFTTNYDLSFEKTVGLTERRCVNRGYIKENLYSIFRYHQTENHKIWHIHGSQSSSRSITLGYEHYSGFLQQMRNYVTAGTKGTYKRKDFLPLSKRFRESNITYESWIDFFLTHNIYIFGLNLDFVEMHLWWLFTYRARAIVEKRLNVKNKILYFYPEKYKSVSKHKIEMFEVNEVKTVPIPLGKSKMRYYKRVIEYIKND